MRNRANIELITGYMQKNKLSKNEFCKRCGVSTYAYDKFFRPQKKLNIVALFNIAREMKLSIGDLIVQ